MADQVTPIDKPRNRRFTKTTSATKDGDTDLMSFRAPKVLVRRVDEIVQSGNDIDLKTKSDALNDALFKWLDLYLDEHEAELPAIRDRFIMDRIRFYYTARQREIDLLKEEHDRATKEKNNGLFNALLYNLMRLKAELEQDPIASPTQLADCLAMIAKIKERGTVT
jgi:Arc/MetJ-type ribon-helix-helix transcriptional regulator